MLVFCSRIIWEPCFYKECLEINSGYYSVYINNNIPRKLPEKCLCIFSFGFSITGDLKVRLR